MTVSNAASLVRFLSLTHSNARLFYDPWLTVESGTGQRPEKPRSDSQNVITRLAIESKYDKPGIRTGWVRPDV